jgi:ribosomal protein L37AE/L43A
MPRRYTPIQLKVQPVPVQMQAERAPCPQCREHDVRVLGRIGLRLVFRCDRCRVQFHRAASHAGMY